MDALGGLLDAPRARGAFLLRSILDPPWSMRIEDEAALTLVAVVAGGAWVVTAAGPTHLGAGDLAVVPGPDHYTVADDPATATQIVIGPGQRCTSIDGRPLEQTMGLGVRTWGTGRDGATTLLTGTYEHRSVVGGRLLEALPGIVVVRRAEWDSPLVGLLAAEIERDIPGQSVVLDRLLDLLLLSMLRHWFTQRGPDAPAWWRATSDPVVGPALGLIHDAPAAPWTIAGLARQVGVSRALLARRFAAVVGEPPIAYLTGWRLALAADLLRDPATTIGAVAGQVGYGSAFALSAAFKRAYGRSPRDVRRTEIGGPGDRATGPMALHPPGRTGQAWG